MEPSEYSPGGRPSPTRKELQGPRPPPLKVRKDSYKIKKPPVVPQPSHAPHPAAPLLPGQPAESTAQNRQPVIIYAVSPKVIHTTVSDFMTLVQRLTGSSSSSDSFTATTASGNLSPAARLASIEKTSPSDRERDREKAADLTGLAEGLQVSQIPGILSPAPATLPPIPAGIFSPAGSDPRDFSILNDLSLSPFMHVGNNMFTPITSPSALFSAPIASPSPSSIDLFNNFFDF